MSGFLHTLWCHRWDKHKEMEYYSEHVEIVFSAIYNSVNEVALKAFRVQGRDVTCHLIEIVSLVYAHVTFRFQISCR
jgi:hypothetical protein